MTEPENAVIYCPDCGQAAVLAFALDIVGEPASDDGQTFRSGSPGGAFTRFEPCGHMVPASR